MRSEVFLLRKPRNFLDFSKMRILIALLVLAFSVSAADFEKSSLRAQVYLGATPYYPIDISPASQNNPDLRNPENLKNQIVVPFQGGFLWSPLFTPAFRWDVPFTLWIGIEAGNWQWAELYNSENLVENEGTIDERKINNEKLSWSQWMPSAVAGVSVNVIGDLDLRLLGGIGLTRTAFTHELSGHEKVVNHTEMGYFGTASLEYIIDNDIFKNTDLKLSGYVRQDAKSIHNVEAVAINNGEGQEQALNGLRFNRIEQTRLKIGLELSLDFGRESRKDRKKRFRLRDRDKELRKHNAGLDTLTEWDCMAIERDYKFFIQGNGDLPDMKEKFTKSQFTDVLESFLAFCPPEDLVTKEKLYASLDSNKVTLKKYQMSQEETRYRQVMASNDINYLKMFLQYYPQSRYRNAIESKVRVLDDYSAFRVARNGNTFKDYLQYIANFPEGHYTKEAETGIYKLVQDANRQKDYEIYLKKFPNGAYVNEARRALHEVLKQTGTTSSF